MLCAGTGGAFIGSSLTSGFSLGFGIAAAKGQLEMTKLQAKHDVHMTRIKFQSQNVCYDELKEGELKASSIKEESAQELAESHKGLVDIKVRTARKKAEIRTLKAQVMAAKKRGSYNYGPKNSKNQRLRTLLSI